MRGILGHGAYLPHRRLDRSTIAAVAGSGGGKGTRTVASFDEDTTTMGVEAARLAHALGARHRGADPRVLDRRAGLRRQDQRHRGPRRPPPAGRRCRPSTWAARSARAAGALRLGAGRRRTHARGRRRHPHRPARLAPTRPPAATAPPPCWWATRPTACCWPSCSARARPPRSSSTAGARPGDTRSKQWEERFGELHYVALGKAAWADALKAAGVAAADVGARRHRRHARPGRPVAHEGPRRRAGGDRRRPHRHRRR